MGCLSSKHSSVDIVKDDDWNEQYKAAADELSRNLVRDRTRTNLSKKRSLTAKKNKRKSQRVKRALVPIWSNGNPTATMTIHSVRQKDAR